MSCAAMSGYDCPAPLPVCEVGAVKQATDGKGVDLIVDMVSAPVANQNLAAAARFWLATGADTMSTMRSTPLPSVACFTAPTSQTGSGAGQSYPDIAAQLIYWQEQLRHPLPMMKLTRRRRRGKIDDFCTARRQVALPAKLSEAAKDFSQREGVTLFMTLVAAFKILLHRYTGEDDVRVATDVANRNRPRAEGLIGLIANTVILRTSLSGAPTAREVIRRVRATTLGALANQDVPFEAVVEALERDRAVEPRALARSSFGCRATRYDL